MATLNILILGAGGIGGYYAARLSEAGHNVVLTARGEHLKALKAEGLTVEYEGQRLHQTLPACSHEALCRDYAPNDFDLIAVTLKSTATEAVMGAWPKQQAGDPREALLKQLDTAFNEAGIPTTMSTDIRYELWRKLVINNGVNPLSALTRLDTRSLTHHPEFGPFVYAMMAETVKASKADHVNLTQQDLDEMFSLIRNFNAIKTSMLVDREKGRPLELDSIAGAVLCRCKTLGVDAPVTALVSALLRHDV